MGWTILLDENDNEVGYVGDSIWDAAGEFCDAILAIDSNISEEEIIKMVLGGMSDLSAVPEKFKKPVHEFLLKSSEIYLAGARGATKIELEGAIEFVYQVCKEKYV